jgi:hypothetical protein
MRTLTDWLAPFQQKTLKEIAGQAAARAGGIFAQKSLN